MDITRILNRPLESCGNVKCGDLVVKDILTNDVYHQKDILGHHGCVNSVEFNHDEAMFASGGDDLRVFLWNSSDVMMDEQPKPRAVMDTKHLSNIFALGFSNDGAACFSGGNDGVMISHDVTTGNLITKYDGRANSVYNICTNPIDSNMVAVTRDNGTVTFYDRREDMKPLRTAMMINVPGSQFYSGQYNPSSCALFAVSSASRGVTIFDLRAIEKGDIMGGRLSDCLPDGAIYAKWNSLGTSLGVLQTNQTPLYIDFVANRWIRLQDAEYENVHTIKSLDFVDDRSLITGSDNFNIYAWDIPDKTQTEVGAIPLHRGRRLRGSRSSKPVGTGDTFPTELMTSSTRVLKGHRSIVNHMRYSARNKMIVSCGVEKIVKCWSGLSLPFSYDTPKTRDLGCFGRRRRFPRHAVWIRRLRGLFAAAGDSSDEENEEGADDETAEDTHMLNYFDELLLARPDRSSPNRWGVVDRRNGVADEAEVDSDGDFTAGGLEVVEMFFSRPGGEESSSSSSEEHSDEDDEMAGEEYRVASSSNSEEGDANREAGDNSYRARKRRREQTASASDSSPTRAEPEVQVDEETETQSDTEEGREPVRAWPPENEE